MKHDLRWLLFLAWPFLMIAAWSVVVHCGLRTRIVVMAFCLVLVTGGLFEIGTRLRPDSPENSIDSHIGTNQNGGPALVQQPAPSSVPAELEQKLDEIEKNTSRTKQDVSPGPAFSVDIEHRIITSPGTGTYFWFGSFFGSACSLEPTAAAIFLRITNLQQHKEMLTAYSVKSGQFVLPRVPLQRGRMFWISPKGQINPRTYTPRTIDFGAPAGMGMWLQVPLDKVDTSVAMPVSGDFLDYKVGEGHYIEPNEPVRGWVFFEFHKELMLMPAKLTVTVTDALQKTFSYSLPDHNGDPAGDMMHRRIVTGPVEDLSRCTIENVK
jgi:hypothetical protein